MPDEARAGRLTLDELRRVLEGCANLLEYLYLSKLDEIRLVRFDPGQVNEEWTSGRAFGELCEIRWRRDGDRFKTLILGRLAEALVPSMAGTVSLDSERYTVDEQSYFVWGSRLADGSGWYETRIPHTIRYPVETTSKRLRLRTVEYRCDGVLEFYRFCGFEEVG